MKKYQTYLKIFFALNLFDALTTMYVIKNGLGYEINPIMDAALNVSPYVFLAIKIVISTIVVLSVVKMAPARPKTAMVISSGAAFIYSILALYEIIFMGFHIHSLI